MDASVGRGSTVVSGLVMSALMGFLAGSACSSEPSAASNAPPSTISTQVKSIEGDWLSTQDSNLRLRLTADTLVATTGPMQLTATYRIVESSDTMLTLDLDWAGSKERALVVIQGDLIEFRDGDGKGASTIGGKWRRP